MRVVATGLVAFVLLGGAALGSPRTAVHVYRAFRNGTIAPDLAVVRVATGSCFTGSLADQRADAWRCTAGNEIVDPCFSAAGAKFVVCPEGGPSTRIVKLLLTARLPFASGNKPGPPTRGDPWAILLASGKHCVFLTGATGAIGGRRINYGCGTSPSAGFLVGSPRRSHGAWSIRFARGLSSSPRRVAIAAVWW